MQVSAAHRQIERQARARLARDHSGERRQSRRNIAPTCAATTWQSALRAFRPPGMTYQVSRLPFAALLDEAGILRARGWSIRASTWKACSKRSAWESLLFRIISPTLVVLPNHPTAPRRHSEVRKRRVFGGRFGYSRAMNLDADICFRAARARDRRFDGHFFVAITSTRIYCRPICPARPAKRENMRFYSSAAAAEGAGFRPCLRCRPERAPGLASVDAVSRLVGAAMAESKSTRCRVRASEILPLRWESATAICGGSRKRNSASRRSNWPRPSGCCWPSACWPIPA